MKYKTCEKCQLQEKWKDKVYRWMGKKFRVTTRKKKYVENQVLMMLGLIVLIIKSFMYSFSEHLLVPPLARYYYKSWK